ncbi:MAG: hypothetical protein ACK4E0_11635 [Chitinophagaceae bacterium]
MIHTRHTILVALCLLALLLFRGLGELLPAMNMDNSAHAGWHMDLDCEQENRESRNAENNQAEELFERTTNISFEHFAPPITVPAQNGKTRLPLVVIDTNTPPPNFA